MRRTARSFPSTPELPAAAALEATVELLATIAHPTRLLVLHALETRGPLTVGALQELAAIEQSAMSHQLRILRNHRLVRAQRRGRHVFYALADHHISSIVRDALAHAREVDNSA